MPTDGPADPHPAGNTASDAEGSLRDRLTSPVANSGAARNDKADGTPGDSVEDTAVEASASRGHGPVDSARQNAGVVGGSRDAAGIATRGAGTTAVDTQPPRIEDRDPRMEKRAERQVAALFFLTVLGTAGFIVVFIVGAPHAEYFTPALGVCMAAALFGLGAGAIVWAKKIMPEEEAVQLREPFHSPEQDRQAAIATFRKGTAESGFVSRPIIRRSLLGATGALGILAIFPLRALAKETSNQAAGELAHTHWFKGSRLINISNLQPIRLGDIPVGGLQTVIPEGTEDDDQAQADSVAIIIRMNPTDIHPVKGYENLDFQGHVVYSKLCTHLGCPVSLYEQQTHVLLCPCHQSQFKADESARPVFGPATRRLPQLAIGVDSDGYFYSTKADFPEPVGPGYWERT